MAEGSVQVELSIDEQKALRAITSLTKKFEDLGEGAKKSFGKGDAALASFAGNLASAAVTKGFALIGDGLSFIKDSIGGFISAAAEQEKAVNSLNTSLAITGNYTKEAAKDFQDYASSIQASTGIGDDAVLNSASLIQNIAKLTTDQLKQATSSAVQFSSAMGIGLDSASSLIGKALEGNVGALGRYGVAVKAGANETETFQNVMKAMSAFAGTAESKLNTFGGSFEALKGNAGDVQETLGFMITQSPSVIAAITALNKGVLFLDQTFKNNSKAVSDFVTNGVLLLVDGLRMAGDAFAYFNKVIAGFQIAGKLLEQSFFGIDRALSQFGLGIDTVLQKIQEFSGVDLGAGQKSYIDAQNASIQNSTDQIAAIDGEINAIVNKTAAQNKAAENFVNIVVSSTKNAIEEQKKIQAEGNDAYLKALSDRNKNAVKEAPVDDASLAKQTELNNAILDLDNQFMLAKNQAEFENDLVRGEYLTGRNASDLEQLASFELTKSELVYQAALNSNEAIKNADEQALANKKALGERELRDLAINAKSKNEIDKMTIQNRKDTLATISTLSSSSNKELAAIGKAAGITQIAIDTPVAISKAMAAFPPPFNFVAAGLVATAMAAQAARIAGVGGFENGGFIPGKSFSGDKLTANVNSGEAVLNSGQQRNFMKLANGDGGNNSGVMAAIEALGNKIQNMTIVVQADGREIARLVRDQRASGFAV